MKANVVLGGFLIGAGLAAAEKGITRLTVGLALMTFGLIVYVEARLEEIDK